MSSKKVTVIRDDDRTFENLKKEVKQSTSKGQDVIIVQSFIGRGPDDNGELKDLGAQIVQARTREEADKVFREVAANVYKRPEKECCSKNGIEND